MIFSRLAVIYLEHINATLTLQYFLIHLDPRMFHVWNFLEKIFGQKFEHDIGSLILFFQLSKYRLSSLMIIETTSDELKMVVDI